MIHNEFLYDMSYLVYQSVKSVGVSKKRIQKVIAQVLEKMHHTDKELSVHLVGTKRMQKLNYLYRGKEQPTDVLAFAAQEGKEISPAINDLGDIFICIPQIQQQAKTFGVSYHEEFLRILIHGILHLLGYDHVKPAEANNMFALQEQFVVAYT